MTTKKDIANKNRKLMGQSTRIILAGVAIMLGFTAYIVSQAPTLKETLDAARPVEREVIVHLSVLEKQPNGNFESIMTQTHPDKVLGFELSTNVPVHVVLLAKMGGKMPEVLFEDARIPPGRGKSLEKQGKRFLYPVLAGQPSIKFCLIQASDTEALYRKLRRLQETWRGLPQTQCASVLVAN